MLEEKERNEIRKRIEGCKTFMFARAKAFIETFSERYDDDERSFEDERVDEYARYMKGVGVAEALVEIMRIFGGMEREVDDLIGYMEDIEQRIKWAVKHSRMRLWNKLSAEAAESEVAEAELWSGSGTAELSAELEAWSGMPCA